MSVPARPGAAHRVTWNEDGRPLFHCDGDKHSACHFYPECGCAIWYGGGTHDPGGEHAPVEHETCWRLDWLNNGEWDGAYSGPNGESWTEDTPKRDAEITTEWEDEYLLWGYIDA